MGRDVEVSEVVRRSLALVLVSVLAVVSIGTRFDHDARCKDLAHAIVMKMFENSPILPGDIERVERFEKLGCSDVFLEVERQRIIREATD
jgi:hypothetical protein